jgi:NAD(P)H dehydrogenase (quinone)
LYQQVTKRDRAGLHKNVIDASVKAGIGHIVYTSGISKGENGYSPLAGLVESHRKTEEFLKISGIPYTILRHNLYAEVIGMLIGDKHQLLRTKTIYLPAGNGVTSFIPKKDLADAAVNIL